MSFAATVTATIGLIASVALGAVLCLAGASKQIDRESFAASAKHLGVPGFVVPFVPWAELVVGAALLAGLGWPITPSLAIVLLVAFTIVIVGNLARGQRPPCACFGVRSIAPISWWTVARNLVLIVLAVVAYWR